MMKETKKSLKTYFLVVGVLGFLNGIMMILTNPDFLVKFFGIVTFIFAVMFFNYGIKMYSYIQNSPKTLTNFVIIAFVVQILLRLLSGQIIYIIISALLGWYLIHNIKKLSAHTIVPADKK